MRFPSVAAPLHLLLLATAMTPAASIGQNVNLALQGTATQSSNANGGVASRAIDGIRDGFWSHNSVTMTQDQPCSWWQVDFAPNLVDEIVLFNRGDCCWLRLANFRVELQVWGSTVFAQDYLTDGGSVDHGDCLHIPMPPGGLPGSTVRVSLRGPGPTGEQVLSLAEVEVLHYGAEPEVNLAPLGVASLSNAAFGSTGREANDGEFDGVFANGSVTHTADLPGSRWSVTLPFRSRLDEIRLWNRTDCCSQRLSNFRVSVFDGGVEVFGRNFYTHGGSVPVSTPEVINLPANVRGDVVQVSLLGYGTTGERVLSLAEVEVIRYGVTPRYTPYGAGCQGTSGTPTLRALGTSLPILGTTFTAELSNMPSSTGLAVFTFGTSATQFNGRTLPLDLAAYGAPGCWILGSAEGSVWCTHRTNSITLAVAVPNDRTLLGTTLYHQAMVVDPNANRLGAAFSNGAQMILGM